MNTTEEIIVAAKITSASDAALIRLVGQAIAMPGESVETLLQRTAFTNAADATLAKALVETVRANARRTANATPWLRGGLIVLALAAAALGAGVYQLSATKHQLESQVALRDGQIKVIHEATEGLLVQLQKQTSSALKTSDDATRENVKTFTETIQQYLDQLRNLQDENARLKLELDQAKKAAPKS